MVKRRWRRFTLVTMTSSCKSSERSQTGTHVLTFFRKRRSMAFVYIARSRSRTWLTSKWSGSICRVCTARWSLSAASTPSKASHTSNYCSKELRWSRNCSYLTSLKVMRWWSQTNSAKNTCHQATISTTRFWILYRRGSNRVRSNSSPWNVNWH